MQTRTRENTKHLREEASRKTAKMRLKKIGRKITRMVQERTIPCERYLKLSKTHAMMSTRSHLQDGNCPVWMMTSKILS